MKKILCLICLLAIAILPSCEASHSQKEDPSASTTTISSSISAETTKQTTLPSPPPQKEEDPKPTPVVEDRSLIEKLNAIPKADRSMTTDELRQICLDVMKLQCSFAYTVNENFIYEVTSQKVWVPRKAGKVYAGIPYITTGSGNIYRVAEFYDPETGVFDISELKKDPKLLGNVCSSSVCAAWSRVVSSATPGYTRDLTPKNGYIPVGPYRHTKDVDAFEGDYDCSHVAKANGEQVMYESYALMGIADGCVNDGHVRMISAAPVVVRRSDGSIDGEQSYVLYCDQLLHKENEKYMRTQSDGTVYYTEGGIDIKASFAELYKGGYIPFTFKEFHDPSAVAPSYAASTLTSGTATVNEVLSSKVIANYTVSDVFVSLLDESGATLRTHAIRSLTHTSYSVSLNDTTVRNMLAYYAKPSCRLQISCRLYNGDLITVFDDMVKK
ncbi:MAG: hypothetical protein E7641_01975 [Ruminococcaceae bacterium]|nr:hypothetical protein [Oscillospiraceae bacterium]